MRPTMLIDGTSLSLNLPKKTYKVSTVVVALGHLNNLFFTVLIKCYCHKLQHSYFAFVCLMNYLD